MISIAATACSGVLISPIHILTAAHCLFYTRAPALPKEECTQIGFSNSRQARSDTFSVFVGSRCIDPNRCRIPWMTPAHVYYHEYYNECSSENDIAIFELADYVPRHWATPICLPERNQTIARYLNVAGSGWRGMRAFQCVESLYCLTMIKRQTYRERKGSMFPICIRKICAPLKSLAE
ncbi:hypothetical protein COOONC_14326 [Cooperia oncophora]